jgi:hypothetical protein
MMKRFRIRARCYLFEGQIISLVDAKVRQTPSPTLEP